MEPIIEVQNLTQIYAPGTPFEQAALSDISLSIREGEFIGIIGHTGSGKTTFVQHLNGLMRPTSGRVLLSGKDIWEKPKEISKIRFRVGMVFQYPEYQLFEETVRKDIAFGPKNMGLSPAEIEERVLAAADFVGLSRELLDRSPFDLSGGQKRRAAIAGVIAMRPQVLILDEPTAGLDPAGREDLFRHISDYQKKEHATVLLVTHSMEDAAKMVSRLLVLSRGKLVMDGTPREIYAKAEALEEIGLGIPQVTQIFRELKSRGFAVDPTVHTIEEATAALLALKGGRDHA